MKINVKKLDETIAKLQELRKLATDPALSNFVTVTGANGPPGARERRGSKERDQMSGAVLQICKSLKKFSIKEVYPAVVSAGLDYREKSVANVLRRLAEDGTIRVVLVGSGRRPTLYALPEEGETQEDDAELTERMGNQLPQRSLKS